MGQYGSRYKNKISQKEDKITKQPKGQVLMIIITSKIFCRPVAELTDLALEWINIAIEKKPEALMIITKNLKIMGMKKEAINTARCL